VSLVRPKLEYASCVWQPFYDVHVNRIERVQKSLLDMCCKDWDGPIQLAGRRSNGCVRFVFDVLSGCYVL
jgi:hypothetical protein